MPTTSAFLEEHGGTAQSVTRAQFLNKASAGAAGEGARTFDRMDANHDGTLDAAEVDAGRALIKAKRAERREQNAAHARPMDSDTVGDQ